MNLNEATAKVLKSFVLTGMIILVIGLVLSETEYGNGILWFGTLVLIIGPVAGIAVTYAYLIKGREKFWASIATILIAVIIIGMLLSLVL